MIDLLAEAANRHVSRETFEKLGAFVALLREENGRQNLISGSTVDQLWDRHIVDSAQLLRFEPRREASWVDIGSGPGLPGIVIACMVDGPVTLIEPRRLRVDFLHRVSDSLRLGVKIVQGRAERSEGKFDVITGRAVAKLDQFLKISAHLSTRNTVWALPKGRNAAAELAQAQQSWQGVFHVEQSVTDADSYIVVATGVRVKP